MRVHLVDGTFELYRAHYSKRPSAFDRNDADIKATLGLLQSLEALTKDTSEAVTHLAVAFDNPIVSFRNAMFAGYKTDAGVPVELRAQFDLVERCVRCLGVCVLSMQEFEADDALMSGAAQYGLLCDQVRILSPDKDLGQALIYPNAVLVDRIRKTEMRSADLFAKRGIRPEQVPDYLALVGDAADGIPGLRGFGEKTASVLLQSIASLEQMTQASWPKVRGGDALQETLRASYDDAVLYKSLATLRTDVPMPSLTELVPRLHDLEQLAGLEQELGRSIRYRFASAQQRNPVE
jgi:5'-3' exonuclease